jgi:23S rRNA (pseudouridine1915-N3)-methyltransferase
MRVHLCVVGRLKGGPEADLLRDYLDRFGKTGRVLGLGPASVHEVEDKRGGGRAAEATLLARSVPRGSLICAMDERGQKLSSPEFANLLARYRDQGTKDMVFMIGGADGLDPSLCETAGVRVSFGSMVWPHMLARVMLSEQLYRAATILSGSPYHRA